MENNYKILKEKAYKVALKFKNSHFEEEMIYAKLEKQGFPLNIAKEVAANIAIENGSQGKEDRLPYKKIGLFTLVLWILLSLVSYFFTGSAFDVYNVFMTIIPSAILGYLLTTNNFNI